MLKAPPLAEFSVEPKDEVVMNKDCMAEFLLCDRLAGSSHGIPPIENFNLGTWVYGFESDYCETAIF